MISGCSRRRPALLVAVLVYAAAMAACKDGTAPLVPSSISVVAGAQQTATAGAAVPVPPSVKVLASNGQPVKGVPVTFVPAAESGTVVGGSQITDAAGLAAVTSWTVGTKAGTSTLNVTVQGLTPVAITATTAPGAAASFKVSTGDVQTGVVGAALSAQPAVRVADSFDNGVPGIAVTFVASGGSIEHAAAQTDANGVASAGTWTLGTKSGVQTVTATAADSHLTGVSLTLSATASPDAASALAILTQPSTTNASGGRLSVQPVVEFRDRFNNAAVLSAAKTVTATVATGAGTLGGTTAVTTQTGRVAFTDLTYTGTGPVQLRFTSTGFADATSSAFTIPAAAVCAGPAITLNYTLGQVSTTLANAASAPRCIDFSATRNAGEQYLLMFENISPRGNSNGLFPGLSSDDGTFNVALTANGTSGQVTEPAMPAASVSSAPANAINGWDFGGGAPVYEIAPKNPSQPALVKRNGEWLSANGSMAVTSVGDTLLVQMEGIPRLSVPTAMRRAIVRYVDSNIVIAEDLRFTADTTFKRESGGRNTPLTDADMQQIASEYSKYSLPQANTFFNGGFNSAMTADPGKPIAIHTMMPSGNIWGYTYPNTNYFVWDFWVNSDGHTKTVYQNIHRNSDDLFMHEIAHTRHFGLLERAGRTAAMGNTWLVEGFARFSERLPIAMRLLNSANPSRLGNVVLPYDPAIINNGQQVYFYDDVPTYLYATATMYDGYGASSYVFDYFADQVANLGGNWVTALRELLVAGGVQSDIDAVVQRYLGYDFRTLFTRSRVALYLDDIGTPGLPAWTQYLQYQLRASRPPGNNAYIDPRNMFGSIKPGVAVNENKSVPMGSVWGYVIDGTGATSDMHLQLDPQQVINGSITLVRIK